MRDLLLSHAGGEIVTYILGGFLALLAGVLGSAVKFFRRLGRKIDAIAVVGDMNSDQISAIRGDLQRVIQEVGPIKERVAVLEYAVKIGRSRPKRKEE